MYVLSALRRQRSQVRILSGAPSTKGVLQGAPFVLGASGRFEPRSESEASQMPETCAATRSTILSGAPDSPCEPTSADLVNLSEIVARRPPALAQPAVLQERLHGPSTGVKG